MPPQLLQPAPEGGQHAATAEIYARKGMVHMRDIKFNLRKRAQAQMLGVQGTRSKASRQDSTIAGPPAASVSGQRAVGAGTQAAGSPEHFGR
jgi:hypothetical protein